MRLVLLLGVFCALASAQSDAGRGGTRAAASNVPLEPVTAGDKVKLGHSHYGAAFDAGPRTRPVVMKNIGSAPFPITTKNPEVQMWFNQGNTLLHHFWDFEAERSFRWALKLEPDNAMVYWGLARATGGERSKEFIREAVKRKDTVTERERLYIESLAAQKQTETLRDRNADPNAGQKESIKILETIVVKYPDDLEAKALLALANMGDSRYGTEQIIREILAKNPDHPGAHHYRIHNWNYHEPEQALQSSATYGKLAPGSGHAQHMPGHVYSTVGMWQESAISMDAATRVEKQNMRDQMTFPYNHWNYGHNRSYLCYIQEQLGMEKAARLGARELINAPLDKRFNADSRYSSHSSGLLSMLRLLVKYERWNDLLDSETIPWRDIPMDKMNKEYAQTRAYLGLGKLDKAEASLERHTALEKDIEKVGLAEVWKTENTELKARLMLAQGRTLDGLVLLGEAAEMQFAMQKEDNDPPKYPELLYNALGYAYLDQKSPTLAAKAFEKSLTATRNDLWALSGLVQAYSAMGERAKAEKAMSQLLFDASDADTGLAVLERAAATGVKASAKDYSPAPQRKYAKLSLDQFGPAVWTPFEAPALQGTGPDGKTISLSDYKGKNVILVYYLGRECLHCMTQLQTLQGKKSEWERLGAEVIAVSPNKPEETKEAQASAKMGGIQFVSDPDRANAKRFQAYDDFEEMEIHATILVDKQGRIHWASMGGDPFSDMDFLSKQLDRMNQSVSKPPSTN